MRTIRDGVHFMLRYFVRCRLRRGETGLGRGQRDVAGIDLAWFGVRLQLRRRGPLRITGGAFLLVSIDLLWCGRWSQGRVWFGWLGGGRLRSQDGSMRSTLLAEERGAGHQQRQLRVQLMRLP